MTGRKYNYEQVIADAKRCVVHCTALSELADRLGIPGRSLDHIIRKSGYDSFEDLLIEVAQEDTADVQLLQRKCAYFEQLSERLQRKLEDRLWLRKEVAGQVSALKPIPVPDIDTSKPGSEQIPILEFSDAHFGLNVPEGQLGLFGTYSTDMATARTTYTFRTFARLSHQQSFPVRKAKVYFLGDNVEHSHMRPSQAKQIDSHVVQQTLNAANAIAHGLRFLCGQFEEVEVEAVPGNHGRTTQKAGENMPDETYDHLIYHLVKHMLSDQPNFTINIHEAWYFVDDIYGFKFLGLHGEDAISWAGIPWYGIKRLVKDYTVMLTKKSIEDLRQMEPEEELQVQTFLGHLHTPDYVCIGHFHNPFTWDLMGVEVIANGAMSGVSLYSAKRLHKLTPPAQWMFWVHQEHGVGLRLPIKLGRVE